MTATWNQKINRPDETVIFANMTDDTWVNGRYVDLPSCPICHHPLAESGVSMVIAPTQQQGLEILNWTRLDGVKTVCNEGHYRHYRLSDIDVVVYIDAKNIRK